MKTLPFIQMIKQIVFIFTFLALAIIVQAQSPNAISYQGVARNAAGNILASQNISLRISIHDVTASGTVVYSESHAVSTTTLGLFNVNIGEGNPVTGTLSGVNWGSGAKFLQVEMDVAGGSNYINMGTTQLMSVPYALYAGSSGNLPNGITDGNTLRWNGTSWETSNTITNIADNVGIGTLSPSTKLDVNGIGQFSGGAQIGNVKEGFYGDPGNFAIRARNDSSSDLYFQTYDGGATNMIIKNNGFVGIGTSTPTNKLEVTGTGQFGGGTLIGNVKEGFYGDPGNFAMRARNDSTSDLYFQTYNGAATNMIIKNKGFVGIGTSTPDHFLTITKTNSPGTIADMFKVNYDINWGLRLVQDYVGPFDIRYELKQDYSGTTYDVLAFKAGNVGIGTTNPINKLDVTGIINSTTGYKIANDAAASGTYLRGDGTNFVSSAIQVSDIPSLSGSYVDLTTAQTIAGTKSFSSDALINEITVGRGGGSGPNINSTAFGKFALINNTTGTNNTAIGNSALYGNTSGQDNTAIGLSALFSNMTGSANTAFGQSTLIHNTVGSYNTALGTGAGVSISTGNLTNATAIGANAIVSQSNSLVLGSNANVGIGTSAPAQKLDVNGIINSATGYKIANGAAASGAYLRGDGTNFVSSGIQLSDIPSLSSSYVDLTTAQTIAGTKTFSSDALINGITVGRGGGNKSDNTAVGFQALNSNTSGLGNTANGYQALYSNIVGVQNTANGMLALGSNTSGNFNTANGVGALSSNTSGHYNTAIGVGALLSNPTGSYNTAIGTSALNSNLDGSYNTALGYGAGVSLFNLLNATAIGANAIVSQSNSLVLGSNANVGIGTSAPSQKLEVVGTTKTTNFQMTDGAGANKILTSDASGNASWAPAPASNVHYIGESYGGGIVFYVYDNGQHGFIASYGDQSTGVIWTENSILTGAIRYGLGGGMSNTSAIIAAQMAANPYVNFAAMVCAAYNNSFSDWYLPSIIELQWMYNQKDVIGGFSNDLYWSSTEYDVTHVRLIDFSNGTEYTNWAKFSLHRVRAIRSF